MQHGQFSLRVQYHRDVINSLSKLTEFKIVFWLSNQMLRVDYRSQDESGAWSEWDRYSFNRNSYKWIPGGEFEGVTASVEEFKTVEGAAFG